MTQLSFYSIDSFLTWMKGSSFPTAPSAVYLALCNGDPDQYGIDVTTTVRPAGRPAVAFGSIVHHQITTTAVVDFGSAAGATTVSWLAVFDAATGGNCLTKRKLAAPATITAGQQVQANIADVTIRLTKLRDKLSASQGALSKLLLHCDGTNGSTTITDSGTPTHTVTATGCSLNTSTKKFGTASLSLPGSAYATVAADAAWSPTGDFTIDFWCNPNVLTTGITQVLLNRNAGIEFYIYGSNIQAYMSSDGVTGDIFDAVISTGLTVGTWFHVAYVRSGNLHALYYNGTQTNTKTLAASPHVDNSNAIILGADQNHANSANVYMDEIRVIHTAAWTTSFTPPSAAYTQ